MWNIFLTFSCISPSLLHFTLRALGVVEKKEKQSEFAFESITTIPFLLPIVSQNAGMRSEMLAHRLILKKAGS
jgi:hypothetical protein